MNKWFIISAVLSVLILDSIVSLALINPQSKKPAPLFSLHGLSSSHPIQVTQAIVSYIPQTPTIPEIFAADHSWIATLSASHIRIMTATGDIIPARSVNDTVVVHRDALWPFEKVQQTLLSFHPDITFINLESPLISGCPPTTEGMVFCGETDNVAGLNYIHVSVANLANNHMGNHGINGINNTCSLLTQHHILVTGIHGPVYEDVKGMRFAFLGYNSIGAPENGLSWAYPDKIASEVSDARKHADVVIVQFHWGVEYTNQPNTLQIRLAHLAIDNGADVIIGNHPHWVQPVEVYKGKLITYAHGNFVFDQMWSQKTREGVVGKYVFYDNHLIDVTFHPVQIDNYGQPHFVDGSQEQGILAEMLNNSEILSSDIAGQTKIASLSAILE